MNTSELRKYIEEALQEVSSEKQRRWACAQTGDGFKGDKKLTDKEAKEMCSAPIEERDRARKSTGQYQDMRIKAKEMLWAYFDEELGAMDARASKRIGNKPSDNLVDEIFNAIMDSVPAEVPDNVKGARKAAEEKRKFADIEKMGIYNLENPSITAKTHKPIKPQPKKRSRFPWGGLGENTMKMTTASLKQMIREELGMDQQGVGKGPEQVALDNLSAAVEALVQNHGYTTEDIVDVVAAEEGSEVVYAMKGDQVVSVREGEKEELEECGYSEEGDGEDKRYFEIR
jgi:hypothetical protein